MEGARMTPDQRVAYLRQAWEAFRERSGQIRDMSSAEYHVLARLADVGRPLFIVLRGISETAGKPRTIHACLPAIERAADYHYQAVSGMGQLPKAGPLEDEP